MDILGHYYEIGKVVQSDTVIFKMTNLNQKSSHKLESKGMNFEHILFNLGACRTGRSLSLSPWTTFEDGNHRSCSVLASF